MESIISAFKMSIIQFNENKIQKTNRPKYIDIYTAFRVEFRNLFIYKERST